MKEGNKEEKKVLQWIEFVDRDVQPNYEAQRGVDMKKVPRHGMNTEEMINLSIDLTVRAIGVAVTIAEMSG